MLIIFWGEGGGWLVEGVDFSTTGKLNVIVSFGLFLFRGRTLVKKQNKTKQKTKKSVSAPAHLCHKVINVFL